MVKTQLLKAFSSAGFCCADSQAACTLSMPTVIPREEFAFFRTSGSVQSTVNLDAESAHDTIFSLKKLMEGRTTIMAAHNEELMKAADCVIRLENGKIMKQE